MIFDKRILFQAIAVSDISTIVWSHIPNTNLKHGTWLTFLQCTSVYNKHTRRPCLYITVAIFLHLSVERMIGLLQSTHLLLNHGHIISTLLFVCFPWFSHHEFICFFTCFLLIDFSWQDKATNYLPDFRSAILSCRSDSVSTIPQLYMKEIYTIPFRLKSMERSVE